MEPTACAHPDHSERGIQVDQWSIHSRQYSTGFGASATTAGSLLRASDSPLDGFSRWPTTSDHRSRAPSTLGDRSSPRPRSPARTNPGLPAHQRWHTSSMPALPRLILLPDHMGHPLLGISTQTRRAVNRVTSSSVTSAVGVFTAAGQGGRSRGAQFAASKICARVTASTAPLMSRMQAQVSICTRHARASASSCLQTPGVMMPLYALPLLAQHLPRAYPHPGPWHKVATSRKPASVQQRRPDPQTISDVRRIAAALIEELVGVRNLFDLVRGPAFQSLMIPQTERVTRRVHVAALLLTLCKVHELYEVYSPVIPEPERTRLKMIKRDVEHRAIPTVRNAYVGHILDAKTRRPFSGEAVNEALCRAIGRDLEAFLNWVHVPGDCLSARSVVGALEALHARLSAMSNAHPVCGQLPGAQESTPAVTDASPAQAGSDIARS